MGEGGKYHDGSRFMEVEVEIRYDGRRLVSVEFASGQIGSTLCSL